MGGTEIEPGCPSPEIVTGHIDRLVDLVGSPERIRWRFDPILFWTDGTFEYDNLRHYPELSGTFRKAGIINVITSLCSVYPKVSKRFINRGDPRPVNLDNERRERIKQLIKSMTKSEDMNLSWCCETGEAPAGCIDGKLLSELHPGKRPAPVDPAAGQREACGCTRSWDIGWYNQVCRGGCLYCYANPHIS
jgi:hypothetical protein